MPTYSTIKILKKPTTCECGRLKIVTPIPCLTEMQCPDFSDAHNQKGYTIEFCNDIVNLMACGECCKEHIEAAVKLANKRPLMKRHELITILKNKSIREPTNASI